MATPKKSSKRSRRRRSLRRNRRPLPSGREAFSLDPRLAEGIALYNHHQFFACHEVLERVWLKTSGRDRDFYKGLIQAAVAFYHWSRGNPNGALTLYRSASRYLQHYRPEYLGVDVERFLRQFSELFGWLRRHRLRYDVHLVPTLHWARPVHPQASAQPLRS